MENLTKEEGIRIQKAHRQKAKNMRNGIIESLDVIITPISYNCSIRKLPTTKSTPFYSPGIPLTVNFNISPVSPTSIGLLDMFKQIFHIPLIGFFNNYENKTLDLTDPEYHLNEIFIKNKSLSYQREANTTSMPYLEHQSALLSEQGYLEKTISRFVFLPSKYISDAIKYGEIKPTDSSMRVFKADDLNKYK